MFTAINLWHYNIHSLLTHAHPKYTPLFSEYDYYGNKVEIHSDAYHNHLIPLLPYKATVVSAACLGVYQYWEFELAQSQDCRNYLYQRTRVKSVPEK